MTIESQGTPRSRHRAPVREAGEGSRELPVVPDKEETMGEWMRAIGYAGVAALVIQLANPDPDAFGSMAQDFAIMLPVMRASVMLEGQMCGASAWLRGLWR